MNKIKANKDQKVKGFTMKPQKKGVKGGIISGSKRIVISNEG